MIKGSGYRSALRLLLIGVGSLLGVWLLILISDALNFTALSWSGIVLEAGILVAFAGIVFGCLLDYLALRKTQFR
ncbi:hypothetical protein ACLK2H_02535 [Escherichia coli]